jgi:hypothetical protein
MGSLHQGGQGDLPLKEQVLRKRINMKKTNVSRKQKGNGVGNGKK